MRKKIDFLNRLFELNKCKLDILSFLKDEKLITDDRVQRLLNENHIQHASLIINMLEELAATDKLQLLSYEWQVLPNEKLSLMLVTEHTSKEFGYSL
jgi:hypothetical protein